MKITGPPGSPVTVTVDYSEEPVFEGEVNSTGNVTATWDVPKVMNGDTAAIQAHVGDRSSRELDLRVIHHQIRSSDSSPHDWSLEFNLHLDELVRGKHEGLGTFFEVDSQVSIFDAEGDAILSNGIPAREEIQWTLPSGTPLGDGTLVMSALRDGAFAAKVFAVQIVDQKEVWEGFRIIIHPPTYPPRVQSAHLDLASGIAEIRVQVISDRQPPFAAVGRIEAESGVMSLPVTVSQNTDAEGVIRWEFDGSVITGLARLEVWISHVTVPSGERVVTWDRR